MYRCVLKMPDAQPHRKRVPAKVRLVDIAPTLLEIAAIPVPSQMQGQSLLRIAKASGGADQPVYSRSDLPQRGFGWSPLESWRAGKYLYIRAPKPELYDLTADPGATHNLAQSSKATLDTMAGQLDNFDRRFSGDARQIVAQLNSVPRCRNWHRSDTWDYRNRPAHQRPSPGSIRKTRSQPPTKSRTQHGPWNKASPIARSRP